jgi:hypothetical protein
MFLPQAMLDKMTEDIHDMSMSKDPKRALQGRIKKRVLNMVRDYSVEENNRGTNAGDTVMALMYALINVIIIYAVSLSRNDAPGGLVVILDNIRSAMISAVNKDILDLYHNLQLDKTKTDVQ